MIALFIFYYYYRLFFQALLDYLHISISFMPLCFCTASHSLLDAHSYLFKWLNSTCSARRNWNIPSSMKPFLTSHLPQRTILISQCSYFT